MKYITAVLCPPLAIALARRPLQAITAMMVLMVAVATWTIGVGVLLAALVIMWACRVVGDRDAKDELEGFLKLFHRV